jgi:hypothetical protein
VMHSAPSAPLLFHNYSPSVHSAQGGGGTARERADKEEGGAIAYDLSVNVLEDILAKEQSTFLQVCICLLVSIILNQRN